MDGTEPLAEGDGSSGVLVMLGTSEGGASGDDSGGSDNGEIAGGSDEGEAAGKELWDALTMARWVVAEGGLLADMKRPRDRDAAGLVDSMTKSKEWCLEKRRSSLTSSM